MKVDWSASDLSTIAEWCGYPPGDTYQPGDITTMIQSLPDPMKREAVLSGIGVKAGAMALSTTKAD